MNVELQCCALFIVLVISALFFRERKLDLNNRTLFVRALCVCIITICLDILSIVAIYCTYYHSFSPILTKIICKLYTYIGLTRLFRLCIYNDRCF